MILRRIASSLKKQDWWIVLIELMILVLGIFIGLQVDDWNLARKERANDRVFLERLGADVDGMIEQGVVDQRNAESRKNKIRTGLLALQTCRLRESEKKAFESALLTHQVMPRLRLEHATFDEMVASGALTRIDDLAIKKLFPRFLPRAKESRTLSIISQRISAGQVTSSGNG